MFQRERTAENPRRTSLKSRLQVAAIDYDGAASHVGGCIGRKQEQGAVQIRRLPQSALGNAADHCLPGIRGEEFPIQIGFYIAWRQRVDANSMARPLQDRKSTRLNPSH